METHDRYLAVHNLGLLQRQAGVERGVAELVTAYGRMLVDAGEPLDFEPRPFARDSDEARRFSQYQSEYPEYDLRFAAFLASYAARIARRGYRPILSREDFATQLDFPPEQLTYIASRGVAHYREIRVERRGRTPRILHSPMGPLKAIQRWIHHNVLKNYKPHDAAHGFVSGRSIATGAARHVAKSVLITLDLADFFPSIGHRQVRKGFERLGYPYSVAVLMANLCTRSGVLPQGAPTSPALSNLVCENLDRRLSGLAASRQFTYSRYADDLAFSSDDTRLPSLLPMVRQIVREEGFTVREEKTRVTRRGARQMVTGVVVNDRLNLPRLQVRRLRAAADRMSRSDALPVVVPSKRSAGDPKATLSGHLGYLAMLNPSSARACRCSGRGDMPRPYPESVRSDDS